MRSTAITLPIMAETAGRKEPRARWSFAPELEADVVALVRQTGKTAG